jgi:glycosidase
MEYVFHLQTPDQPQWFTPQGLQQNSAQPQSWFHYDPRAQGSFDAPQWVRDAIFYQIFPERFCNGNPRIKPPTAEPWGTQPTVRNFMGGDLQGILDKLEYLDDLGINAIYLTPIFRSASNHKYDTIDYFTIDPHFGDIALLKELVRSCHARDIRVILDAVFNHCSNLHPFFLDVKEKGRASRYWNWFFIKKWPIPDHFAKHKDALEWYECWWGFHTLPKLDYTNPQVEEYFLKVAQHWLREADIDGWRLDVPNEVIQTFWPKFRAAVKQVTPQAYIVGEIWDDATPWLNGDQFDAVMNYRFQKALIGYFAEETMDTKTFDQTLRQVMLDYPEQATSVMLNLLGSHDTARPMTLAKSNVESIQLTAAMQFTFEGAPCIYYGDEIGLEGGKDPDCRRCYPWDNPELQNRELLAYYKKLIAIRKANPALRTGTFHPFLVDNARSLYAFERRANDNRCIVALNRDDAAHELKLPSLVLATELITGQQIDADHFTVPARQAVILRVHA